MARSLFGRKALAAALAGLALAGLEQRMSGHRRFASLEQAMAAAPR